MPVNFIKDAIFDHLTKIDYKAQTIINPNAKGILKETLLNGDRCSVKLLSDREFEVKIPENLYHEIVATDFCFSLQKVKEQSKFLTSKSLDNIPTSWVIVSAYYSAFYSAVELSKLFGIYNLYLKKEHCDTILTHADGGDKLDRGNYRGIVNSDITDYITIRFSASESVPPHDLAWKNMLRIVEFNNVNELRATKVGVYKLIKGVLNTSGAHIQTPNNVRNDWNYSFANAYDADFCNDVKEVKAYLKSSSKLNIMSWPNQYRRLSNKQNDVFSVIYIEAILRQSMLDLSSRLLR
ncbi:hypothetical protein [Photobacterium damselae]|uniref:hypothetical protein n=1 Tax=Photobacterium damselae TaxID=38293 RepID=UPI004068E08E